MMMMMMMTTTNFVDNSLLDSLEAVDHEDPVQLVLLSVGLFRYFIFCVIFFFSK
jgi:hypothetical protein